MSFADRMFANAIRGTLAEPAVGMVNFRAKNRVVGTMHLQTVSVLITTGQISCKIDPSKVTTGAAAVYSMTDKTIYGLRAEGFYADEKSTFVHESTHAAFHVMGAAQPTTIKNLDNEICAYLAGAIYIVASGQTPGFANRRAPDAAAYAIASTKGIASTRTNANQTNAASPIEFLDAELTSLAQAIKSSPLYRDWNQSTTETW